MQTATVKKEVDNRLARAEGHLKKVRLMLEEDSYCPDIIHQSQAVQAALKKVDEVLLNSHLHTCVLKDIRGKGSKREKLVEEILGVFNKQNN